MFSQTTFLKVIIFMRVKEVHKFDGTKAGTW